MSTKEERAAARDQLEVAINNAIAMCRTDDPPYGDFISSWIVVAVGTEQDPDADDDLDVLENLHHFHRRGQGISTSRGIAESYIDYLLRS
jgi:hypothetical protein